MTEVAGVLAMLIAAGIIATFMLAYGPWGLIPGVGVVLMLLLG